MLMACPQPGQDDDSDNEAPPRGPKEEEEEEEEDDEDAEVRYGADFKDKLMAASLDLEREEIDEQPLPPQQDQPQEQQSPALAPAPEDVATKFVLPLAPPAEEAAALASQPLSGSNLSGTMHSTAAAWEGAWDDEANALEGQDSLGREDGAARRSSEGTEKDDDERGNGELAVSSQHHRRQSATTHHVVIETGTHLSASVATCLTKRCEVKNDTAGLVMQYAWRLTPLLSLALLAWSRDAQDRDRAA